MSTKQNNCSVFRVHRNTNTRQITALTPILSERKKCALSVPAESALYGATPRNESSGFLRRLRSRCRGVLRKLCGIAQWVSCTSCFWTVREPARYSVPQGQTDFWGIDCSHSRRKRFPMKYLFQKGWQAVFSTQLAVPLLWLQDTGIPCLKYVESLKKP